MFYLRLISFIVLTVTVVYSLLSPHWSGKLIFTSFSTVAAFLVILETFNMLEKINRNGFKFTTAAAVAISILLMLIFPTAIPAVIIFYLVGMWLSLLFVKTRQEHIEKILTSFGVICLVAVPLSFMIAIYLLMGPKVLLFMILVTKSGDTGAYITGTLSNIILKGKNHKIVPGISPKKSWEGTIGGMILSVAVSVLLVNYSQHPLPLFHAVVIGIFLFWGGFCGDLTESVIKRSCGVKDSGNIVPGMGGVFDFLDSLLLNAPIFFIYFAYVTFFPNT